MTETLRLGSLTIHPPLLLAPMAGLSHSALRALIAGFGGCGLFSTEMLSAASLPQESAASPYLLRTEAEKPLSCQLLAAREEVIPPAVARLHALGAEAIDLNLGCPAPNVRRMGGGAALMSRPETVRQMLATARRCTNLPLSAKIRLGEALDAQNEARLRDFCRMLEGEGLDFITVHARLRGESFCRKPHWAWVAKVKAWVSIPVLANGGVDSPASARACLAESGADGLMIGRMAAQKPWIFAEIARDLYGMPGPGLLSLPAVYRDFAAGLAGRFPQERRLGRLKEFTHYFAANWFFGHHLASRVQQSRDFASACAQAEAFFAAHPEEGNCSV